MTEVVVPANGRIQKLLVELAFFRSRLRNDPAFAAISPEERQSIAGQVSQLIAEMDRLHCERRPVDHRLNPHSAGDYFPSLDRPVSSDHSG